MLEGTITKLETVDEHCIMTVRIKNPTTVVCPDASDAESEEHLESMNEDYVRDKILSERYDVEKTYLHLGNVTLHQ